MEQAAEAARFERLLGYLAADPGNLRLLAETAEAAFSAARPDEAARLVDVHAAIAPPPPSLINLLGLCALGEGRYDDAARIFSSLLADAPDDPGLRFNLAWARNRSGDHAGALEVLDAGVATPQAAALRVRSLHHLQRFDEALALGDAWEGRADDPDLWAALASVALDSDDLERGTRWASRGQATAEGQAALGMLALVRDQFDEARPHFEKALAQRPDSARGLLGLGSVLLAENQPAQAAEKLDQAGEIFGDHLGSWVAAGWAWFVAGDNARARARFERTLSIDDTFSEAHGGLALIDLQEGRTGEARHRAEIALRLDRQSLGGALVQGLLLESAGDTAAARKIITRAMNAPVGPNGRSIAQVLASRAAVGR
jgi:tetratricopeptide (TPR) repeat protein